MVKTITTDVARLTQQTRDTFFVAFDNFERICSSIDEARQRFEECSQRNGEARASLEKIRAETADSIATYNTELKKVDASISEFHRMKDERRKAAEDHQVWSINLSNAKTRGDLHRVESLKTIEPTKPESIVIPELVKMDEKIEAEGLAALHALAVASSDYVLSIAAHSECLRHLEALEREKANAEAAMIEKRKEFERDVNVEDLQAKRRIEIAERKRESQIKALKMARDSAEAQLKAMGVR